MNANTPTREPRLLVADLPAEHLEDLEYLWDRRESTRRSPERFAADLADVDRRMEANVAGLLVAPRVSLPLLEEALGAKEVTLVAAAAWTLLRLGGARAEAAVLAALESGAPPAREGARAALVRGPAAALLDRVRALAAAPDPAVSVAASEVLAAHGDAGVARALPAWLGHADATVRLAACRIAAWCAAGEGALEPLARADADPAVRASALEAAAWVRAPWLLALGRERARAKSPADAPVHALFASLAEPADAKLIEALGADAALGPERFAWLASYGSVAAIEACLAALAGDGPEAAAAGLAFTRTTGFVPGPARRLALAAPADAGPDAAEFADEAFTPDPERAAATWRAQRESFAKGRRWNRGHDVDAGPPPAGADLAARAEGLLRARHRGTWTGSRREFETLG